MGSPCLGWHKMTIDENQMAGFRWQSVMVDQLLDGGGIRDLDLQGILLAGFYRQIVLQCGI